MPDERVFTPLDEENEDIFDEIDEVVQRKEVEEIEEVRLNTFEITLNSLQFRKLLECRQTRTASQSPRMKCLSKRGD
jgi:CO dehydrogenase/acetyl-CoA synthase delta subunit